MRPGPCLGLADPAAWPIISRSGRDHARSVRESLRKFSNLVTGWAVPFPLTLIRRDWTLFFVGFRSWRKRARWAWHKLNAAPSAIRIVVIAHDGAVDRHVAGYAGSGCPFCSPAS